MSVTIRFLRSPRADLVVVSDRLTSKAPESGPSNRQRPCRCRVQQGLDVVLVGRVHEAAEVAAVHRLERLAHERREACVGVGCRRASSGPRRPPASVPRGCGAAPRRCAACRPDCRRRLDDQGVDLAMPNRAQHLFGFGEAHAQRLGLFAVVGGLCPMRCPPSDPRMRSSPSSTRSRFDMSPMIRASAAAAS